MKSYLFASEARLVAAATARSGSCWAACWRSIVTQKIAQKIVVFSEWQQAYLTMCSFRSVFGCLRCVLAGQLRLRCAFVHHFCLDQRKDRAHSHFVADAGVNSSYCPCFGFETRNFYQLRNATGNWFVFIHFRDEAHFQKLLQLFKRELPKRYC